MEYRIPLAYGLQKCVENLLIGEDTRDYTVIVGGTLFKCHRFILTTCSGFFQDLFKSDMREEYEDTITLYGMSAGTFDIILGALYKGSFAITEDNALDLWVATHNLQIAYLTEDCSSFVQITMSVDNCFRILKHAMTYDAQNVIEFSLNFISKHFDEFRQQDVFLQLPFDYFYKVIADDCLQTDREEMVVETVLQWVLYAWRSAQDSFEDIVENMQNVDLFAVAPVKRNSVNRNVKHEEGERRNRRQYVVTLLSACRLLTIQSNSLDILLNNYVRVLDTGALRLMHEAVMYTTDVSRRHDAWPEAAVHRDSSPHKHVMMFLSDNALKAYDLNTDRITEFSKLSGGISISNNFTVFDNTLLLLSEVYDEYFSHKVNIQMLSANKTWTCVNVVYHCTSIVLLPHGKYIYYCCQHGASYPKQNRLDRFGFSLGHLPSVCCQLPESGDCLVRFHQYILVFSTKNDVLTAHCYNTDTEQTHTRTTPMRGKSQDMASFKHKEEVYILQGNGILWKVFSTDTNPVNFKQVLKFADTDYNLRGCVLYKKTLFVFSKDPSSKYEFSSLENVFKKVRIINIDTEKPCLPMIIKE